MHYASGFPRRKISRFLKTGNTMKSLKNRRKTQRNGVFGSQSKCRVDRVDIKNVTVSAVGRAILAISMFFSSSLASAQSGDVCPDGQPKIRAGMMLFNTNAGPQGPFQVLTAGPADCLPRFFVYAGRQQVEVERRYVAFPFDLNQSQAQVGNFLRPNERVVVHARGNARANLQVRTVERAWTFGGELLYQLTDSQQLFRRVDLGRIYDVVGFRYHSALQTVCQIVGPLSEATDWCSLSPGMRVMDVATPCTESPANREACGHLRGDAASFLISTIVRIYEGRDGLEFQLANGSTRGWLHIRHPNLFGSGTEGESARAGGGRGRMPAQGSRGQTQVPRRMAK